MNFSSLITIVETAVVVGDWTKLIVPAAVAVSVFFLGVIVAWLKANVERRRDTRHLRATVITWVGQMGNAVKILCDSCADFGKRAAQTHEIHPEQFKFNSVHASKISGLELSKTIKAFVTNTTGDEALKNENYYKLISGLEFLADVENEIRKKYDEHYTYTLKLLDTWNKNFIAFDNAQREMLTVSRERTDQRVQLEGELNQLITKWLAVNKEEGQNIDYTHDGLLAPYEERIDKYLKETNAKEEEVSRLLSDLQDLIITFRQWALAKEAYSIVFNEYATKVDNAYKQTLSSANFFRDSTQLKWFCN